MSCTVAGGMSVRSAVCLRFCEMGWKICLCKRNLVILRSERVGYMLIHSIPNKYPAMA